MSELTLAFERWADMWPEAKPLAEAHFAEVERGLAPLRPFKMDSALMQTLEDCQCLWILVARASGQMVGYFTWQVHLDIESEGLLIAQQGAWYVAPGHPSAALALWSRSVLELRAMGVKMIFPHHRTQGRGQGLGKFFQRRGAKLIQQTYALWIGEEQDA